MKMKLKDLKQVIKEALNEIQGPVRGWGGGKVPSSGRKVKLGKIEDENRQIPTIDAAIHFPGSVDAWCEIVPDMFPDLPFKDERSIRQNSLWFSVGGKLRVAFKEAPQLELMEWNPERQDWFELNPGMTDSTSNFIEA